LSLGGQVDIVSVVGKDENGRLLRRMLADIGANVSGLFDDDGRPTIIKTRVIARNQQIVRIDRELRHEVDGVLKDKIIDFVESSIPEVDAVIFSDYDKGVVSKELIGEVLRLAQKQNIPVIIDPKERNFWNYKGATAVTPNLKEVGAPLGVNITDEESLLYVGKTLLKRLELSALLVTKGEHGMSLFEAMDDVALFLSEKPRCNPPPLLADGTAAAGLRRLSHPKTNEPVKITHIPTVAREVFDVTGAGDTVVAVFTLALAAGASMLDAAMIANCAAGVVVGVVGTASVTKEELIDSLEIIFPTT